MPVPDDLRPVRLGLFFLVKNQSKSSVGMVKSPVSPVCSHTCLASPTLVHRSTLPSSILSLRHSVSFGLISSMSSRLRAVMPSNVFKAQRARISSNKELPRVLVMEVRIKAYVPSLARSFSLSLQEASKRKAYFLTRARCSVQAPLSSLVFLHSENVLT